METHFWAWLTWYLLCGAWTIFMAWGIVPPPLEKYPDAWEKWVVLVFAVLLWPIMGGAILFMLARNLVLLIRRR